MKTYKIPKDEIKNLQALATGYKAVKWNLSTNGATTFRYGAVDEDIVGTAWRVDGDIKGCNWGLHFSKDPANVFNFYEPLGYNRYFKINAYEQVIDTADGIKSVAQIIEFVEEYNVMQFIAEIKKFDRTDNAVSYSNAIHNSNAIRNSDAIHNSNAVSNSHAVSYSNAVRNSYAVSDSSAVSNSNAIHNSNAIRNSNAIHNSNAVRNSYAVSDSSAVSYSNAVSDSYAISYSNAVSNSYAVSCSDAVSNSNAVRNSYGISKCEAVKNCVFCYKKDAIKYYVFNKKVLKDRFSEVYRKMLGFNFKPDYMNWYEIKGNEEWWAFNFEKLAVNDNPWSGMPTEMLDYIKALPEYNEKIFKVIVGDIGV